MNRVAKLGLHFQAAYETEQADDYYQHLDPCETAFLLFLLNLPVNVTACMTGAM